MLLVSAFTLTLLTRPGSSTDNLVGYWTFDEGSGTTAADSSGNGNTGTLYNSPTWVNGKRGKALSFDGQDDYVRVPQSASLDVTSQVTVEAWIHAYSYTDHNGENSHIISRTDTSGGSLYALMTYAPGSEKVGYAVKPVPNHQPSTQDLQLHVWVHLAMTYDGSYVRLYINGQFDTSYSQSGSIPTTTNWLAIGCNSYGETYAHFSGIIDEVRIYNKALTQQEIQADMGPLQGPRSDRLYIKYYSSSGTVYDGLKYGEVDLTNAALNQAQMDEVFSDSNIMAATSPAFRIYQLDINNNATVPTYCNWSSPTSYRGFRQAVAFLVNKTYAVNDLWNYSTRIDTPIARPAGEYWADLSVSQYDSNGNLLSNYPYEYESNTSAYIFDQSGFVQGDYAASQGWRAPPGTPGTVNPYYDSSFPGSAQYLRVYPQGHIKAGQDLDQLIFFIRNDDPRILQLGRTLRDYMRKMGIPVNATEASLGVCYSSVAYRRDYHFYVGGWIWRAQLERGLGTLMLYSSDQLVEEGVNYVNFANSTYDYWFDISQHPSNVSIAKEAANKCQEILIEEAASVWLLSRSLVMAYRDICGVVDAKGELIGNRWTFLNARSDVMNITDLEYGIDHSPYSLNIITDYFMLSREQDCLDRIYDTLLAVSPYDSTVPSAVSGDDRGNVMPWMARDWEMSEWQSPYEPDRNLTKITFFLREGIEWHDNIGLNSSDIKFTIEYIQQCPIATSDLKSLVEGVDHVTTPDPFTIEVYQNASDIWTLDRIGMLPILPQHIFESLTNVTGYVPGGDQGLNANQTLIGSGAWKYVSDNSSMLCLEANRNYFIETPPPTEVDFRYDWELGAWTVDGIDATMVGEAFGTSGSGLPGERWEPGCDLNGDGVVNGTELAFVSQGIDATWGMSVTRQLPQPTTECRIYLDVSSEVTLLGESLTATVKMTNVENITGAQFKLSYDNLKTQCLNATVEEVFSANTTVARNLTDQEHGLIWICMNALSGMPQANGNVTLATIIFNATQPGSSVLDLSNTKLARSQMPGLTCQLMPHQSIDRMVVVGASTPTGTNVSVRVATNANVTFAQANTAGVTTLIDVESPSVEFASATCYQVETTAEYSGNVTLQFAYDPAGLSIEDEQAQKIWLWNETTLKWLDVTSYVDTVSNIVYGVPPHLSIFGVHSIIDAGGTVVNKGDTTVANPSVTPDPPSGFTTLDCYEIETTTQYEDEMSLRVEYDDEFVSEEAEPFIRISRWDTGAWIDITTRIDTVNNVVYAVTSHLSIFGVHSIVPLPTNTSVIGASSSKTIIGKQCNVTIRFTVANIVDFTSSITLQVYRNSTVIETKTLVLNPKAQVELVYIWNTSSLNGGQYTICAFDHIVSAITVTISGDLTSATGKPDMRVDMRDISYLCTKFLTTPSKTGWDPNCDITSQVENVTDDVVNMRDISRACTNFMKTDP